MEPEIFLDTLEGLEQRFYDWLEEKYNGRPFEKIYSREINGYKQSLNNFKVFCEALFENRLEELDTPYDAFRKHLRTIQMKKDGDSTC